MGVPRKDILLNVTRNGKMWVRISLRATPFLRAWFDLEPDSCSSFNILLFSCGRGGDRFIIGTCLYEYTFFRYPCWFSRLWRNADLYVDSNVSAKHTATIFRALLFYETFVTFYKSTWNWNPEYQHGRLQRLQNLLITHFVGSPWGS
jgi:hypothetical protein